MYKLTNSPSITRLSDGASIPADPANTDYAAYLQWLSEGNTPTPAAIPPAPTSEQILESVVAAIQGRLDNFAKTRGYDGILSACTYASSKIARFMAEGQGCVNLRDATWSAAYVILGDVQAGNRPMPTLEQTLSELPPLEWPA